MALTQPAAATIVPLTSTYDDHAGATNDANTALVQMPGLGLPVVVALDLNGRLVPTTSRAIAVDTFGAAATDDMNFAAASVWPDGLEVEVELATSARKVTVRHNMDPTGVADALPIQISDGQSVGDGVLLDSIFKRLWLQRRGSAIVETGRAGFPDTASTIGAEDQDFGGFQAVGMRAGILRKTGNYTLLRSECRGVLVLMTSAASLVLPDPNDQTNPDTGEWWQPGDMVLWECGAASLGFVQWDGNPPFSALNHDRAFAQYAQGWVFASWNTAGTALQWRLAGITKAPGGGGGGTARTFAQAFAASDTTLPNDTAWHTAHSLNHAYGASEKWLYVAAFGFLGAGTTANNAAVARFVRNTGSDVEIGHAGRPRWATGVGRYGFVWAQTYGGTAGNATYRIDAQNVATGFATTVQAPAIVALRLESGEDYHQDLGPHGDSAGTFVDANTWTVTTAADDFVIVAGMETTASGNILYDVQMLVDGVAAFPAQVIARDGPQVGSWTTVWPVTLTAASHTFKLQIRRNPAATGTATATNATIALLKKASFQQVNTASSGAVSTYSTSAYTAKLSAAWTLAAGYQTLVLGSVQAYSSFSNSSINAKARFRRNAALLQPESVAGVRLDASFEPSSALYLGVLQPQLTTDAFDVGGASGDNTSTVELEGAALVALALA